MAGCNDSECRDWRKYVKSKSKGYNKELRTTVVQFTCLDPTERDYREYDDKEMTQEIINLIVEEDKHDIIKSDALLVNYMPNKRAVGTIMETLEAWNRGKWIIVNNPPGFYPSPWLQYHSHGITHNLDDAIEKILRRFR